MTYQAKILSLKSELKLYMFEQCLQHCINGKNSGGTTSISSVCSDTSAKPTPHPLTLNWQCENRQNKTRSQNRRKPWPKPNERAILSQRLKKQTTLPTTAPSGLQQRPDKKRRQTTISGRWYPEQATRFSITDGHAESGVTHLHRFIDGNVSPPQTQRSRLG